jgi:hypothetical protein
MIDYNTITTVNKNFNYEQTIAENQTLKYNNKMLITAGVVVGFCLIGFTIYRLKENKEIKLTKHLT